MISIDFWMISVFFCNFINFKVGREEMCQRNWASLRGGQNDEAGAVTSGGDPGNPRFPSMFRGCNPYYPYF